MTQQPPASGDLEPTSSALDDLARRLKARLASVRRPGQRRLDVKVIERSMEIRHMVDAELFLAGRRVLVVEDEYLLATELVTVLVEHGAQVLGPIPSMARARRLLATAGRPDAAVLDVNLGGELVWPLAETLLKQGVPIVVTTGYDADVIPAPFALLPRCEKPTSPDDILAALRRVLIEPNWQPRIPASIGLGRSPP